MLELLRTSPDQTARIGRLGLSFLGARLPVPNAKAWLAARPGLVRVRAPGPTRPFALQPLSAGAAAAGELSRRGSGARRHGTDLGELLVVADRPGFL